MLYKTGLTFVLFTLEFSYDHFIEERQSCACFANFRPELPTNVTSRGQRGTLLNERHVRGGKTPVSRTCQERANSFIDLAVNVLLLIYSKHPHIRTSDSGAQANQVLIILLGA